MAESVSLQLSYEKQNTVNSWLSVELDGMGCNGQKWTKLLHSKQCILHQRIKLDLLVIWGLKLQLSIKFLKLICCKRGQTVG